MNSLARVEVINTGTELLFGSVVNTHLSYLGQSLFPLGLRIQRQTTVPDGAVIRDAILEAAPRSEFIFVTGGLGPTSDDITREIVAELTNRSLEYDETIFARIQDRFARRGLKLTGRISRQAYVPKGASAIPNDFGTAPGLYVPAKERIPHLLLFPGPPRELQPMLENYGIPLLRGLLGDSDLYARVFRTTGLGESMIEEIVGEQLTSIPELEVGYCARLGEVDVRIIGSCDAVEAGETLVRTELAQYLVSAEAKDIEQVILEKLIQKRATLAVAESCTGGLLAHRITNVPGASAVFLEGNVVYSNEAKTRTLGVPNDLLSSYGAVSEEVAKAMAEGALIRSGASFALSTTGIAGPEGGTAEKPVGTVYLGLAQSGGKTEIERLFFPMDRLSFKSIASQYALNMLRRGISS